MTIDGNVYSIQGSRRFEERVVVCSTFCQYICESIRSTHAQQSDQVYHDILNALSFGSQFICPGTRIKYTADKVRQWWSHIRITCHFSNELQKRSIAFEAAKRNVHSVDHALSADRAAEPGGTEFVIGNHDIQNIRRGDTLTTFSSLQV